MNQQRFDKCGPDNNSGSYPDRKLGDTTTGTTTNETAQKIARGLEEQGHPIDPEQEELDEEETGDERLDS